MKSGRRRSSQIKHIRPCESNPNSAKTCGTPTQQLGISSAAITQSTPAYSEYVLAGRRVGAVMERSGNSAVFMLTV
jgi:hypothetical protein